ncbi:MAG: hypothetical protein Q4E24_15685 [bacterium]|nr:hypothetical protein [bacterium]
MTATAAIVTVLAATDAADVTAATAIATGLAVIAVPAPAAINHPFQGCKNEKTKITDKTIT